MFPQVLRAGQWFLQSGIQNSDGGVARYCRLDLGRNEAVSTEITGYAASAMVFLREVSSQVCHRGSPDSATCDRASLTGPIINRPQDAILPHSTSEFKSPESDVRMLESACDAARFLCGAWDAASGAMPFELSPARFTYFFDCGIIVRGLLAVWGATGDEEFLECARKVGDSMAHDFRDEDGGFHPILTLPDKRPLVRDALRWSRSTGCYQLKSAMAWWDLSEATGDACYRELYLAVRQESLRTAAGFLPGHTDRRKVVDRLHAYLYFLEGLLPMPEAVMGDGIELVARWLRELAPEFERSDVYAQLLRVRMYADAAGVVKLDRAAAQWEADRLVEFAREDGGFYFGRSAGEWEPYVNPVSAAFALQALALWGGMALPDLRLLI